MREHYEWIHEGKPAQQRKLKAEWDAQIAEKRAMQAAKADQVAKEAAELVALKSTLQREDEEKRRKKHESLALRSSIYLSQVRSGCLPGHDERQAERGHTAGRQATPLIPSASPRH